MRWLRACVVLTALAATFGCSTPGTGGSLTPQRAAGGAELVTPQARERVRIKEFADLPRYGSYYVPGAVAAGPAGLIWVIDGIDQDFGVNALVGIDTSGKSKHTYYAGSNYESLTDIAIGSDGALWMTDDLSVELVRATIDGAFTLYPVPSDPIAITSGPDKALWVTAARLSGGAIERVTTKGKVRVYNTSAQVDDIATGSDGALWFSEVYPSGGIGRITTHGKVSSYTSGITSIPGAVALGPDGAIWFTEYSNGQAKIGRITTSGAVTEYTNGISAGEVAHDIAAGPDGAMWFTESAPYYGTPKIGRISMSGHIIEYGKGLPTQAGPSGIVAGPDGNMWFTDAFNDETGRVSL